MRLLRRDMRFTPRSVMSVFSCGNYFSDLLVLDAEHIFAPRSDGAIDFSDGVSWRPEPEIDLRAVHGTDPENLYGVGPNGLSHYDGERWTSISPFDFGGDELSVFAVGPREVYAAGARAVFRYTIR